MDLRLRIRGTNQQEQNCMGLDTAHRVAEEMRIAIAAAVREKPIIPAATVEILIARTPIARWTLKAGQWELG